MFGLLQSNNAEDAFRSRYIFFIVAAFAALGLSAFFYIRDLESLLGKRSIDELSRTSHTITTGFRNRVLDKVESLEALSMFVAKYEALNDRAVLETLHTYSQNKGYRHIAVIDREGMCFTSEGLVYFSGDRDYFVQGMQGRESFSGPYYTKLDSQEVIAISVPIRRGEEVIGILRSAEPVQAYEDFFRTTIDNPDVHAFVINPDGTIITTSMEKEISGSNLYDHFQARNIVDREELPRLISDLKAGNSRLIRHMADDGEQFIFFDVALDNVYIVSLLPASHEAGQLSGMFRQTFYMVLALVLFFLVLMAYMLRFRSTMTNRLRRINRELQSVIANTPGGAIQTQNDAERTMSFLSDGFLELCDYSRRGIRETFESKHLRMMHPDDRNETVRAIDAQLRDGDDFAVEYRLKHKSRDWIWVLQKGRLVAEPNHMCVYSTLMDISESKQLMEQSLVNARALRQLLDISGNSLFDFNPGTGMVTFSSSFSEHYGWPSALERFPQSALEARLIHEDDIASFLELIDKLYDGGDTSAGGEYRLRDRNGAYIWCSVAATVVFDRDNVAVKIVGRIEDIDQRKRSLVELEEKTLHDPFTGLYNKISASDLIVQSLSHTAPGAIGALFIIDADNFKNVNDTLGHPVGDQVLKDVSGELSGIFRASDIIGRLGGDEFIVYMHNVVNVDLCRAKAEAVCAAFRKTYDGGDSPSVSISASVGVALYPVDASDYRSLYQQADKALYQAKHQGKDQFVFASEGEQPSDPA